MCAKRWTVCRKRNKKFNLGIILLESRKFTIKRMRPQIFSKNLCKIQLITYEWTTFPWFESRKSSIVMKEHVPNKKTLSMHIILCVCICVSHSGDRHLIQNIKWIFIAGDYVAWNLPLYIRIIFLGQHWCFLGRIENQCFLCHGSWKEKGFLRDPKIKNFELEYMYDISITIIHAHWRRYVLTDLAYGTFIIIIQIT